MNPANPTAPWVTWDETVGGVHQVFVSRFVATPAPHFQIVNGGQPISTRRRRLDPRGHHVLGQHAVRDLARGDERGHGRVRRSLRQRGQPDVRARRERHPADADAPRPTCASRSRRRAPPIRSTPTERRVRAERSERRSSCSPTGRTRAGCSPTPTSRSTPVTGAASGVTTSAATVSGTVNPEGAPIRVSFQFGTTTAYGQTHRGPDARAGQRRDAVHRTADRAAGGNHDPLPGGGGERLRDVRRRRSDADDEPGRAPPTRRDRDRRSRQGHRARPRLVRVTCAGAPGAQCNVSLRMTVTETFRGHRLIAVAARVRHKVLGVGSAAVTLSAGNTETVRISLNRAGRKPARLAPRAEGQAGGDRGPRERPVSVTVSTQTVTFKLTLPQARTATDSGMPGVPPPIGGGTPRRR